MKRKFSMMLVFASMCHAAPAVACMTNPSPNAIVFGSAPDHMEQTLLLQVKLDRHLPESHASIVSVVDGPKAMVGRRYRMQPEDLSSCTTFGRDRGFVRIESEVHYLEGRGHLLALASERSWSDVLFSWLLGGPYQWPGDYTDWPGLEERAEG